MRGKRRGPLHGVPVTLKESLSMAGKVTSCGSTLLQQNVTPESATAVARLRAAGAIPIGRTNVPDMGMDAQTHNLVWGTTRNPWDRERTCGGSSGGEAAAIASGMSPLGLGSDVAGSIRIPAAFCGILGLKPTQHRVSVAGHVPSTLHDYLQIGPLARSIDDIELALRTIAGPDGKQSSVPPVPLPASSEVRTTELRVGVINDGSLPIARTVKDGIARAARAAVDAGHHVEPAEFPGVEDVITCLARIFGVGLAALARNVRHHPERYHPYLTSLSEIFGEPTARELEEAYALREELRARMMACFTRHDLLICPQVNVPAFPIGTPWGDIDVDGTSVPFPVVLVYSFLMNVTGNPSLVIPTGCADGLPIGVQLVGRMWDEPTILGAARPIVEALGGIPRPPKLP
jgi:aspartyl-tRNA(Asn)/glutamyl-tRNA(Gln) amidotransferase subunit A